MTVGKSNITVVLVFGAYIVYKIINPPEQNDLIGTTLFTMAIELVGAVMIYWVLTIFQNLGNIKLFFQTRVLYRNKEIRISIAYLFRIKVDNKYLLVRSRNRSYFQPVGGAFKSLPGSELAFGKLGVKPDRLIETENGIAKGDLRVFVKGSNVIDFLAWFDSKEDRETSPWREFCEELISTDILPHKPFRYIDYKFKKSIQSPILKLDSGDRGIFKFEIYDLVINDEQRLIFNELLKKGDSDKYIWADEYLINRLGHDERSKQYQYDIAPHTRSALNLKWINKN